jgi:hypothetical protein
MPCERLDAVFENRAAIELEHLLWHGGTKPPSGAAGRDDSGHAQ